MLSAGSRPHWLPSELRKLTMAVQSRGAVNVMVHSPKVSLEMASVVGRRASRAADHDSGGTAGPSFWIGRTLMTGSGTDNIRQQSRPHRPRLATGFTITPPPTDPVCRPNRDRRHRVAHP